MKKFLLKTWLLLACLLLGVGTSWAEKITDYTDIVSGKKYYIGATTSSSDFYLSVDGSSTSTSKAGTAVTNKSDATAFVFEGSGTSWTIKFAGTSNYLGLNSSKDNGKVQVVSSAATFTLSNQSGKIRLTIGNYSVQKNNSGTQFGSYANTQTDVWLEEALEVTKYTVSVAEDIANGTVTVNPTSAAEGTTVTLTATPDDGYEFDSWNVTDASSNSITVTNNKFTMPAANVNVSASFYSKSIRPENEIFYESFDTNDGTGGNDNQWSGSIATSDIKQDNEGWVYVNAKGAKECAKFGTGSALGSATTPALGQACNATLTFKAAAWNGNSESTTLKLSVIDGGSISPATVTITKGAWNTFTATLTNLSANSKIKFEGNVASNSRFFLDEVSVVKTSDVLAVASIAVSGTPSVFWKGDTFNHNGMTVTAFYEDESDEDVTSAAEFSGYDMDKAGVQTVTVTYGGKSDTYDITVKTIANTQETAYTTTEAIALIDAGKDLATEVYVTGVVSKVDSYNESHKSITYWLDDNSFEVYGGLAAEGEEFSSADDIEVGATVVVLGKITTYKGTYELNSNNHLVSYTAPAPTYTSQSLTLVANNSDGYYATFSSSEVTFWPEDYVVSAVGVENGELYTFDNEEAFDDDIVEISSKDVIGYYVPANTGILVYSVDVDVTYYTVAGVTPSDDVEAVNMLKPASEAMTGDYKFYKLAYNNYAEKTGLGFYYGAADGGAFTAKTGGAYLAVPTSAGAREGFAFDESTGIESVETEAQATTIYTINGVKVNEMGKGLYIQNGKKIMVK